MKNYPWDLEDPNQVNTALAATGSSYSIPVQQQPEPVQQQPAQPAQPEIEQKDLKLDEIAKSQTEEPEEDDGESKVGGLFKKAATMLMSYYMGG